MIIYKITNNINDKVYIGQTINSLKKRWNSHKSSSNKKRVDTPLYNAMKKYGIDNFKIEEIDGANNITELNYKEWLLIYKNNSLWPNGYNLIEGGGSKGKMSAFSREKLSNSLKDGYKLGKYKLTKAKKVINIETGEIYKSAKDCWGKNQIQVSKSSFRAMLNGRTGNGTPFRYIGEEDLYRPMEKPFRKKVINIETGKIYKSAKDCAKKNGISIGKLYNKLRGITINETPFRYVGMEDVYREAKGLNSNYKKVINIETGEIYKSCIYCARKNKLSQSTLSAKLLGKVGNETPFRYIGMEDVYKKPGIGAPKKVINIETGETWDSAANCARKNGFNYDTFKSRLNGSKNNNTPFKYLD